MLAIIILAEDKNACIHVLFWKLPCFTPVFLVISVKANQQFFSCGQIESARMATGSHSSTSLTSCVSALNCADLLQIWLSSQTGAVSYLNEKLAAVFTGVHTLEPECMHEHMFFGSFRGLHRSKCFFLIFTGEELV